MKKLAFLILISISAMLSLFGMEYSPDNPWGQSLQKMYLCAKDHKEGCRFCIYPAEQWNSKRIFSFSLTELPEAVRNKKNHAADDRDPNDPVSVTVSCGPLAWAATLAAITEKNAMHITEQTATAHIVAAVQKCQDNAGKTIEDEQTIIETVVIPWIDVNRIWATNAISDTNFFIKN